MTDLLTEIIEREGGERVTNDPDDAGGLTQYGITRRDHPEAWADGKVTLDEARAIYNRQYRQVRGIYRIPSRYLQAQVTDFAVTSSPARAVKKLQEILGVEQDGQIGPQTLERIVNYPSGKLYGHEIPGMVRLNIAYERARGAFYIELAKAKPSQLKYITGWLRRTLGWRDESEEGLT